MLKPLMHTSDVNLFPTIDARIRREIKEGLLFGPWIGKAKTGLVEHKNGAKTFEVIAGSDSIVESVGSELFLGGGDMCRIPLGLELEGDPIYGDAFFEGTGEDLRYRYRDTFINLMGKTVSGKLGIMDSQRKKQLVEKLESKYTQSSRALVEWFRIQMNAQFISPLFEGHSSNLTAGLDVSPNGIGASIVYHPHMFINTVNASTGAGSIESIGDDGKNKTEAQLTAALSTNYSDLTKISTFMLNRLAHKLEDINIPRMAKFQGRRYWLISIDREMLDTLLETDTSFKETYKQVFMGKEFNNPFFGQETWLWRDYMFLVNKQVTRSWDADIKSFAGKNGYVNNPTCKSGEENGVITVYGRNALGYADIMPYETRQTTSNYELQDEMLAFNVFGIGRGEYVKDEKAHLYFKKGNNTRNVLSETFEVKNQSSLQLVVKK